MKRSLLEFRVHWKNYIFQSLLAAFILFISLLLFNIEKTPIMIASIGATAFVIFAMPNSLTAKTRNTIGGYIAGIITGSLCAFIPHDSYIAAMSIYSVAVGVSIFIMVVADLEHPPASGAALSFAINGFELRTAITVISCVIILSLIRAIFKKHLRDLT